MDKNLKKLHRFEVGAISILDSIARKLNLKQILEQHIPSHGNEKIPTSETILLLIYNIALGKRPLYKLEEWTQTIDFRSLGYQNVIHHSFNDDRFGRSLDKLYESDRSSIITALVTSAIKNFDIDTSQLHNDSTSIKAFGKMTGTTDSGLELKRGKSKDHRPDLKQLIYSLSISADGSIPIHHKVYSGNRNDDTTHIETWDALCKLCNRRDFIYVADSKLCANKQLNYIVSNGGKAITIMPNTWKETKDFKAKLSTKNMLKIEILRRIKPGTQDETEYFSVFKGEHLTYNRNYKIHWIYSSEKKKRDRIARDLILKNSEQSLLTMLSKINARNLKTKEKVEAAAQLILKKHQTAIFLKITIGTSVEMDEKQRQTEIVTLAWIRDKVAIKKASKSDGIFPLLSTDLSFSSKKVLLAYKYQPNLEKKFSQLKSMHNIAPLLLHNITRIEANLLAFFIALMIQALVAREINAQMHKKSIKFLAVYPESRCSHKPTANAIFQLFEGISAYQIKDQSKVKEEYKDDLSKTHKLILKMLNINEKQYWLGS